MQLAPRFLFKNGYSRHLNEVFFLIRQHSPKLGYAFGELVDFNHFIFAGMVQKMFSAFQMGFEFIQPRFYLFSYRFRHLSSFLSSKFTIFPSGPITSSFPA
jgi:hypothetical protein